MARKAKRAEPRPFGWGCTGIDSIDASICHETTLNGFAHFLALLSVGQSLNALGWYSATMLHRRMVSMTDS